MSGGIERIGWAVRVEHADGWRWHWDFWDEERAVMEAEAWAEDGYNAEAMPIYAAPEGTIESLEAHELTDEDREALRLLASTAVWISDEVDEDPGVRAKMDRAVEILGDRFEVEHITARDPDRSSLEAERDELRATVERYREALEEIESTPCGVFGHSVAVGCGSNHVARRALNPEEEG